jgi:hypothetical protein
MPLKGSMHKKKEEKEGRQFIFSSEAIVSK